MGDGERGQSWDGSPVGGPAPGGWPGAGLERVRGGSECAGPPSTSAAVALLHQCVPAGNDQLGLPWRHNSPMASFGAYPPPANGAGCGASPAPPRPPWSPGPSRFPLQALPVTGDHGRGSGSGGDGGPGSTIAIIAYQAAPTGSVATVRRLFGCRPPSSKPLLRRGVNPGCGTHATLPARTPRRLLTTTRSGLGCVDGGARGVGPAGGGAP